MVLQTMSSLVRLQEGLFHQENTVGTNVDQAFLGDYFVSFCQRNEIALCGQTPLGKVVHQPVQKKSCQDLLEILYSDSEITLANKLERAKLHSPPTPI